MDKEEAIEFEGTVVEVLPDGCFRVRLDNGHEVLAYTFGRMKKAHIRVLGGDRVAVEMTPTTCRGAASRSGERSRLRARRGRRAGRNSAGAEPPGIRRGNAVPRLFVAIEFPQKARLCAGMPDARWVDFHLTLRFIAAPEDAAAAGIAAALRRVAAPRFRLMLAGVGNFGLRAYLAEHANFRAAPFEVAEFALIESRLNRDGPVYRRKEGYPLLDEAEYARLCEPVDVLG